MVYDWSIVLESTNEMTDDIIVVYSRVQMIDVIIAVYYV